MGDGLWTKAKRGFYRRWADGEIPWCLDNDGDFSDE